MHLNIGAFIIITSGDYIGTWYQVISKPYYDKILGDFVYHVEHLYGFTLFLAEKDIKDIRKYRIKDDTWREIC